MSRKNICKIKSFVAGDSLPAITVNFDCGQLMKEETSGVTCDVMSAKTRESEQAKQVVILSRKNQLYAGGVSNPTESICNTLLLIRNKRTGKAKLVSSSACQLLNCTYKQPSSNMSFLERSAGRGASAVLAETFGSKRTKRRSEIYQKMQSATASTSAVLEQTLESLNDTMEVDNPVPSDGSVVAKLLPPCNRDATSLDEIYSVDQLLTIRDLEELRGAAELYVSSDDIESDPDFLMLPFFKALDGNLTVAKVQLLLYANSLIHVTRLNQYELNWKAAAEKICMQSKVIGMEILKAFTATTGTKRTRTPDLTDRAYCHAMVAILLACDYKFNVDWFFGCLKACRRAKVTPLLRIVGLVPLPKNNIKGSQYTHHLKLPLPPLSLMAVKSRGKRA